MTLAAFAADRRAAVDMDRKAAAPAADAPCSNRSISPARRAHSSKPAARCCSGQMGQTDGRTDGHRTVTQTLPHTTCYLLAMRNTLDRTWRRSEKSNQGDVKADGQFQLRCGPSVT